MKNISYFIIGLFALLILGCANKFETKKFDTDKWVPTGDGIEGVVYYEPQLMKIQYSFTTLVDKEGKCLGSSESGGCVSTVQKEEIQVLPNYKEPRVLLNKPSNFSSGKFGVTLSNGMLTAVNSESSSQLPELIKEVTGGAGFTAFSGTLGAHKQACNAGPKITSFNPM